MAGFTIIEMSSNTIHLTNTVISLYRIESLFFGRIAHHYCCCCCHYCCCSDGNSNNCFLSTSMMFSHKRREKIETSLISDYHWQHIWFAFNSCVKQLYRIDGGETCYDTFPL